MTKYFEKETKYKNIKMILSPNGLIIPGYVFTGIHWEQILVFESDHFAAMFEIVDKDTPESFDLDKDKK